MAEYEATAYLSLEKLKENRLDISALKPGMYYIHLVGPNGILALEKLVVIR